MRNKIIIFSSIIIIALISIFGIYKYNDVQDKKKEEEYVQKLKTINLAISLQTFEIKDMCKIYSEQWQSIINGGILINNKGQRVTDFNEAIEIQKLDFKTRGRIDKIASGKENIDKLMKDINNAPEKYKDTYEIVLDLYGSYTEFEALAESPQGSLVSFNQKIRDLSNEIDKKINQINTKIP